MRQRQNGVSAAKDAAPSPMLDPSVDLAAEWRALDGEGGVGDQPPRSLEEFREQLRRVSKAKARRSLESEEEEDAFYRAPDGQAKRYAGRAFFEWLCPANPTKARLRVERLYWIAWKQVLYGFFMSGIGTMLLLVGFGCTAQYCEEKARGLGVLVGALLLCVPGYYCLFVLYMYVTCRGHYSYQQLPEA